MKDTIFTIIENTLLARDIYRMRLSGDVSDFTTAGQFINIALSGKFLRRPISIYDYDDSQITIVYKIVGEGTRQMAQMQSGSTLQILTGLGKGFQKVSCKKPLLIGGGLGIAPLYALAKQLPNATIIIGAKSKEDLILVNEFKNLGRMTLVATEDGSVGTKGFVTDVIIENSVELDYFYTCGPIPMMKAIVAIIKQRYSSNVGGQLSLEERMGCGFGACMGCSIMTTSGAKRVCKDGPVFKMEDLLW